MGLPDVPLQLFSKKVLFNQQEMLGTVETMGDVISLLSEQMQSHDSH